MRAAVRWLLVILSAESAASAVSIRPVVLTCYDGAATTAVRWGPSRWEATFPFRLGVCDRDRERDGACHFQVQLGSTGDVLPLLLDACEPADDCRRMPAACRFCVDGICQGIPAVMPSGTMRYSRCIPSAEETD